MTQFDAIRTGLKPALDRLNSLIRSKLSSGNALMDHVIDTYLTTKGKQIRPIIVLLCGRLAGNSDADESLLSAAAAVELLHNASLIHDDVVDESKLRRNKPTINAVWDNHIAVLVGDFFVSTSLQQAIATGDVRIIEEIGRLGKLLSLGEIDQIYNAREHTLTEEGYFRIIDFKTASLFVACARVGCYAAGADAETVELLSRAMRNLGLCFQIRDDIFDYFTSDKVGKPTGNDLREGKITLPLLHALTTAPDEALRREMLALVRQPELTDARIASLVAFACENGGIDYAYGRMHALRDEAARILAPFGSRAADIIALFDYIIAREF